MENIFRKAFMTGYWRHTGWDEFSMANPHEERTALYNAYMAGTTRDYVWVEPNIARSVHTGKEVKF